ncbi:MAG: bifunctional chorismate mutase/prephenate dehydrogenase [bacterium]
MPGPLDSQRERIDAIDRRILELLQERNALAAEVLQAKLAAGLPIFVPERESQKVASFREAAGQLGLDPEWAEDFLRMIMSASRARQSVADFPRATPEPRTVLVVGGRGRMGSLYGRMLQASGHLVRVLDQGDWDRAPGLAAGIDAAIVSVPIRDTEGVITRLGPLLPPAALLADFTSVKKRPLETMLAAHPGPVLGLHPMHAPDVGNLSKQLLICCPGRQPEAGRWLLDQAALWGMRVKEVEPGAHDRMMNLVQGLRHFVALLHGSFMRACNIAPGDILELSSPIYRAELMMTGRIFAQNAELYADIVFADQERRQLLLDFASHHARLAELAETDDKEGFIREFAAIGAFFGDFADQAMRESGYLIHRLADRFV